MNTDQEIEDLKRSQDALEAKLKDLIERSPTFRHADSLAKIERLARYEEQVRNLAVMHELHPKKWEFLFLPAGIHSIAPSEGRVSVLINEQTAIELEGQRRLIIGKGKLPFFDFGCWGRLVIDNPKCDLVLLLSGIRAA